ncbi:hypothetical protein TorRG33x02_038370 [Trema orientale]|uniref:Uncharacterized protein n=1 Tax=Trema orientale TaxID=63057 RepID=A0A2P5FRP3_TREOI|nr:hypothetical protein TorRG33x02_038370 [Trema orientale]
MEEDQSLNDHTGGDWVELEEEANHFFSDLQAACSLATITTLSSAIEAARDHSIRTAKEGHFLFGTLLVSIVALLIDIQRETIWEMPFCKLWVRGYELWVL